MADLNLNSFNSAHTKLIDKYSKLDDSQIVSCIKYFYEISKDYGQPDYNVIIDTKPIGEQRELLHNLLSELVNIDLITYVSKAYNPRLAGKMHKFMSDKIENQNMDNIPINYAVNILP
jgi:hypothetical protein